MQFGPNCTTFLLAGELYPTDVRTTAHGTSAGVAKLGALWVSSCTWLQCYRRASGLLKLLLLGVGGQLLQCGSNWQMLDCLLKPRGCCTVPPAARGWKCLLKRSVC